MNDVRETIQMAKDAVQQVLDNIRNLMRWSICSLHYYRGWPAISMVIPEVIEKEHRYRRCQPFYDKLAWHNVMYDPELYARALQMYRVALS